MMQQISVLIDDPPLFTTVSSPQLLLCSMMIAHTCLDIELQSFLAHGDFKDLRAKYAYINQLLSHSPLR